MKNAIKIAVVAHHSDNSSNASGNLDNKWVTAFSQLLKLRLGQLINRTILVEQFFPSDMAGGSSTETKSFDYVIAVYSQWFIRSQECIDYVKFLLGNENETRLWVVSMQSLNPALYPSALKPDQIFQFWRNQGQEGKSFLYQTLSTNDKSYWSLIDDMANMVSLKIKEKQVKNAQNKNRFTVYLAEVSEDLQDYYDILKRELLDMDVRVLPESPLSRNIAELTAEVRAAVSSSELSLHCLGAEYGFIPAGSNRSLIEIQNDIAEEYFSTHDGKRLVWIPENCKSADEKQSLLLEETKSLKKKSSNTEVIVGVVELYKSIVMNYIRELRELQEGSKQNKKIAKNQLYVICDYNDHDWYEEIEKNIGNSQLNVVSSAFEPNERALRETHVNFLNSTDSVLFVYEAGNEKWLNIRIADLQRARSYGREKGEIPYSIAVGRKKKSKIKQLESLDCEVFDLTSKSFNSELKSWIQQHKN